MSNEGVKKATRSRRVDGPKGVVSKTGLTVSMCHCRFCMNDLNVSKFYQATDTFLDKNGFMSVCKDCISKIYTDFYRSEKSMEKVLLRMCRMLNVRYGEDAVSATRLQLQTQGKSEDDGTIFGIYKSKVVSTMKENVNATSLGLDITFHEPEKISNISIQNNLENNSGLEENEIKRLRHFWGENFEASDYEWLEAELASWKHSNKIDTRNEESLLQLIILKLFDIRKKRNEGGETTQLEKSYQDLLKTSALSPNMMNAASNTKSMDALGVWIKDIENFYPIDIFVEKDLYKNYNGIEEYGEKYLTAPLRSFVTGSREFNIEGGEELLEEEEN